jgi:transposase
MARPSKYPEELRERAVRMVAEIQPQYSSQWAAITALAGKLRVGAPRPCGRGFAGPRSALASGRE